MNGTYFKSPSFQGDESSNIVMEQSYIENILRFNKGKRVKVYISFPDSVNWKDKIFDGYIEQAGRDHLVMSLEDGRWILLPMIYLDYVEFYDAVVYKK